MEIFKLDKNSKPMCGSCFKNCYVCFGVNEPIFLRVREGVKDRQAMTRAEALLFERCVSCEVIYPKLETPGTNVKRWRWFAKNQLVPLTKKDVAELLLEVRL